MELYPLAVHVEIDPPLPIEVARHALIQLAQRMNTAVVWDGLRVNPLDICYGSCVVCNNGNPSPKPQKPPVEAVSGWETTGIAWEDYDG